MFFPQHPHTSTFYAVVKSEWVRESLVAHRLSDSAGAELDLWLTLPSTDTRCLELGGAEGGEKQEA